MLKVVEGIYKDGNVKVKVDELPDVEGTTPFVIFVKNDMEKIEVLTRLEILKRLPPVYDESEKPEISEKEFDDLSNALKVPSENDQKPFRIIEDGFFAMPPEDLGEISEEDLDKILADEAIGHK
jgi:hypothetical protein